ncbi:flavin monoamine oxidase family protein [Staphylococcus nepalensis]|uniref:flavin monoamine oxidase family protein n=1 Tax=Staphylococcus nepalensis TaxID=214473 RepID=UPI003015C505
MPLQVLIIGGGVAGLRIGTLLSENNISFKIVESRERLGGRVLTKHDNTEDYFDLGPTWYWPDTEKHIESLLNTYNLSTIEQYNEGDSLLELSQNQLPKRIAASNVNNRSKRIVGGVNALVTALNNHISDDHIILNHKVESIYQENQSSYSVVTLNQYSQTHETFHADIVVLTVPPRLVLNSIDFRPPLPQPLQMDLLNKPTWMGAQAKIVVTYQYPFWRDENLSGNVVSWAGPLREIYDATTSSGKAALFGFFSLPPAERNSKSEVSIKEEVIQQLTKLFGSQAQAYEQILYKDWSQDGHTVTEGDKLNIESFPSYGPPPKYFSNMLFAGTEYDAVHGGHIEGALSSANQISQEIRNIVSSSSK